MDVTPATRGAAPAPADPRPAAILMYATYVTGGVGIFLGFLGLSASPPTLRWAALVGVGLSGVLSFVRHSVVHRSDAARMGWDLGRRDNFQIEVGLANLAWGLLAILVAVLDWGLRAAASSFLVFGFYLVLVAVMLATSRSQDGTARPWGGIALMGGFGAVLVTVGVMGMTAAG